MKRRRRLAALLRQSLRQGDLLPLATFGLSGQVRAGARARQLHFQTSYGNELNLIRILEALSSQSPQWPVAQTTQPREVVGGMNLGEVPEHQEVVVTLKDEETASLRRSLALPRDATGAVLLEDAQVARFNGLKVEVFSNEHPPPHFRVKYQSESNNFTICECEPLNGGSLRKYFGNIKKWWNDEGKELLIKAWNERRPSDCPVGRVECE